VEIDNASLQDIDVFPTDAAAPSVFSLMNTCRTAKGPRLLDAFLRRPQSNAGGILGVQASLSILGDLGGRGIWPFPAGRIEAAEKYLLSNILVMGPSFSALSRAKRAFFAMRHRHLAETLDGHARNMVEVLTQVEGLPLRRFSSAPGPLGAIGRGIEGFLSARSPDGMVVLDSLPRWRKAPSSALDWIFRGGLKPELNRLLAHLHELDMLLCLVEFNQRNGLVNPEPLSDGDLRITADDLRNLFLPKGQGNEFRLGEGRRLLFLTGPNMAGKSTLLKAVGLATYLSHLGLGVPAKRFVFSVLGGMLTGISISDSLSLGNSYYMSEVKRVKEAALLAAKVPRCLLLFDETFKGTNVKDASDATFALVKALARLPHVIGIISSHLHEVAQAVAELPNVVPMKMEAVDGAIRFAYRLEAGVSTQRLGMRLLEEQGVLALLDSLAVNKEEDPAEAA
jgi:DNA mismatch repair protein MutS